MGLRKDFQDFVFRGNVVDLAVGVMIGAAFGKIVTAAVDDVVMPIVSVMLPGGNWREAAFEPVAGMKLKLGHFLGVTIDFVITAAVLFFVLVKFIGMLRKKAPAEAPPATKVCAECLEAVPSAARRCKHCTATFAALALLLLLPAGAAQAQPPPQFQFVPEDKVKVELVEKKLQARGGLVHQDGNSEMLSGTLGAQGAYQEGANRFSGEAGASYSRTGVLTLTDANANALVDDGELGRVDQTTSKLFQAKGRYDRFFTTNNAAYVSLQGLTDVPAGKELVAGGQVGYSRLVVKSETHRAVAEIGYDLSLERATAPGASLVQVHSARVFGAEEMKISEATGLFLNVEALFNLNGEKAPAPGYEAPAAFEDSRVVARTGITTKIWEDLAFGFSFGLRYDQAPAPLKAPAGAMLAPSYRPLARTWDTTTEASLVMTFF